MQKFTTAISTAIAAFLLVAVSTVSAQAPQAPKLDVLTPQESQTIYGDKVPILFDVQGFTLTEIQAKPIPVAGQGHIHLWLDDQNPTAESAAKVAKDEFTFSDVAYGEHTLKAELVSNNHKSLTPPQVLTVKFKNEAITNPSPVNGSAFDKNTALVILIVVALVIVAAWWYTKEEDNEMEEEKSRQRRGSPDQAAETKKTAAKKKTPPAGGKRKTARESRRK